MKENLAIGMVMAAVLLVALPSIAQEPADKGGVPCGIEGTWYGTNSSFFNFVFRMEKNAAGGYSIVADGFPDIPYCLEFTAWHGEMAKIGPSTYAFRQIHLCRLNPDVFGTSDLTLWASEGELTLLGCNQLDAHIPNNGAYLWGSGKVPFVDEFDLPPFGLVTGTFDRMPPP